MAYLPKTTDQYKDELYAIQKEYVLSSTDKILILLVEAIVDLKDATEIPYIEDIN